MTVDHQIIFAYVRNFKIYVESMLLNCVIANIRIIKIIKNVKNLYVINPLMLKVNVTCVLDNKK